MKELHQHRVRALLTGLVPMQARKRQAVDRSTLPDWLAPYQDHLAVGLEFVRRGCPSAHRVSIRHQRARKTWSDTDDAPANPKCCYD